MVAGITESNYHEEIRLLPHDGGRESYIQNSRYSPGSLLGLCFHAERYSLMVNYSKDGLTKACYSEAQNPEG